MNDIFYIIRSNIYTLDLARLDRPIARIRTFADDVLVSARGGSRDEILSRISPALTSIQACCEKDRCEINGDKAAALHCTLRKKIQNADQPVPTYGEANIPLSTSMRYLGVVFDKQLSYTEHVNTTLQRATKGVNALKAAAGRRAEVRHLVTLYKALVISIIDFALPMIQMSQNQVNRIERLQNACLRTITGCTRSTPIPVLHYLTGVTSIQDRQCRTQATAITRAMQ